MWWSEVENVDHSDEDSEEHHGLVCDREHKWKVRKTEWGHDQKLCKAGKNGWCCKNLVLYQKNSDPTSSVGRPVTTIRWSR